MFIEFETMTPYFMIISNICATQYGCRIVGTLGGVATAVFLGLSSFCQNLISLGICYGVLCGFGFGMVYISLIVACGFYFEKRLALAQGIMAVGASIGELPTFTQTYGLL